MRGIPPTDTPEAKKIRDGVKATFDKYNSEMQISIRRHFDKQINDARADLNRRGLPQPEIERKIAMLRDIIASEVGQRYQIDTEGYSVSWDAVRMLEFRIPFSVQPEYLWERTTRPLNMAPVESYVSPFQNNPLSNSQEFITSEMERRLSSMGGALPIESSYYQPTARVPDRPLTMAEMEQRLSTLGGALPYNQPY